jgi:hypothetical protein
LPEATPRGHLNIRQGWLGVVLSSQGIADLDAHEMIGSRLSVIGVARSFIQGHVNDLVHRTKHA